MTSRRFQSVASDAFIDQIRARREATGSSLKFCRVAEGRADVYPRLGPSMEWDTAAGHALLAFAGGWVETDAAMQLHYGKHADGFRNPGFVACGDRLLLGVAA